MRGTAFEVSGTFFAIIKRNTVWPRRQAIDMVHFCPPAAKLKGIVKSGEVLGSRVRLIEAEKVDKNLWQVSSRPAGQGKRRVHME